MVGFGTTFRVPFWGGFDPKIQRCSVGWGGVGGRWDFWGGIGGFGGEIWGFEVELEDLGGILGGEIWDFGGFGDPWQF